MAEPTQVSIWIDPVTDDLGIPFRLTTGKEAYAQRLGNRYSFFLGEWFLDLRQGVPWYERIFLKETQVDERIVRTVLRRVIEMTPGTKRIIEVDFGFDYKRRTLNIEKLQVEVTDGQTYLFTSGELIIRITGVNNAG